MIVLPGIRVLERIYESFNTLVYRGIRESDRLSVILKQPAREYPTPAELIRYQHEYEILSHLSIDGVIQVYDLQKVQNSPVLLLEDFGAQSLSSLLKNRSFNILEFLKLAINLTQALEEIHQKNVIHKNINPANILVNLQTGKLKIIDFSLAIACSSENFNCLKSKTIEGTPAYLSPEQTGRMNQTLDRRTDFYSLGVTFYQLLTNQLPFIATDFRELVHCHLAKKARYPYEINSKIPLAISSLVMKLMAKTVEERYQSAWGIRADLESCLAQLKNSGTIAPFSLGCQDSCDRFEISQKLYGREKSLQTLLSSFEKSQKGGRELVIISGYSGTGKSSLVQELYKPLAQTKAFFISGKYDRLQHNIPYSAIVSALKQGVRQLLTETEANLKRWRDKIRNGLGINGQIIIDVIPDLELIIGKQLPVPKLDINSEQNRFNFVFKKFIQIFAQKEHSLVIFIDDLQWADTASIKLFKSIVTDPNTQYILAIAAYRNNEVSKLHPLAIALSEIETAGIKLERILLSPLKRSHIEKLLVDSLKCESQEIKPLAELILAKTRGNPFFVNEFLKSLYSEQLLFFVSSQIRFALKNKRGNWQWNLEQIKAREITDNVVELMVSNLKKLSDLTQNVLQLAACLGDRFELKTLSIINEQSQQETLEQLYLTVQSGLILVVDNDYNLLGKLGDRERLNVTYKFAHDRIQQAAYSLIPEEQKQARHLRIGQLLLNNTLPQEREERIFDIVNQINIGWQLIEERSQQYEIARLNLLAGKKAKVAAAYEPALTYFQMGLKLLGKNCWQNDYSLAIELQLEATEAAYLNRNFSQMEQLAEVAIAEAKTILEKIRVYQVIILAYSSQNQSLEAVKTAIFVLQLLDIHLPQQPTIEHIVLELTKIKNLIGTRSVEELINLPLATEPEKLAAMELISNTISAAYFAFPEMMPLLILEQINLSLRYGHTNHSAPAYAHLGLILCGIFSELDLGYRFGELALHLLSRLNATEVKAKTICITCCFTKNFREPIKQNLKLLKESYQIGLETGDIQYMAHALATHSLDSYFIGKNLLELEREMANFSQILVQLKQEVDFEINQISHQTVLNLMGQAKKTFLLVGEVYNEEKKLPLYQQVKNRTLIYILYIQKSILAYLFEETNLAFDNTNTAAQYVDAGLGSLFSSLFYFYDSLIRLAIFPKKSEREQKRILSKVAENQQKIKLWSDYAPSNYLHQFYLIEAEKLRVLKQDFEAMNAYDRAIELAKEHEYLNNEALAYELATKFYLEKGKNIIAKAYLQEAYYCYLKWGATAKVKHLENKYFQLLAKALPNSSNHRDSKSFLSLPKVYSSATLDLAAILEASQALSGEIILENLLEKLMEILIKNAGATIGFLIDITPEKLLIEAIGSIEEEKIKTQKNQKDSQQKDLKNLLPIALLNYVTRTQESIVINNPSREGKFTQDTYIKKHKPKSILCAPIIHQGKLTHIIYLENHLAVGAFTSERLEILKLLSSQAAIALANAKLYAQVQQSEHKLNQFLEAIPIGISVLDRSGQVKFTNQTAQHLLNTKSSSQVNLEQLSQTYQIYCAGTNTLYPIEQLPLVRSLAGETVKTEDIELHQNDKIIPLEVSTTPIIDETGEVNYAIAAFTDISERKRAEKLIADYNQTLEQQVQERTLELQQEIIERKRAQSALQTANLELKRLVMSDGLTQVANRRYFDEYLSQEWKRALREKEPLSLIFCDVDYFKQYNDNYGHQAGDECLKQVAQTINLVLKRSTDLAARYGGEEFAAILPNTDVKGAAAVAQDIRKAIAQLKIAHARSQVSKYVTLSMGISSLVPTQELFPKDLIVRSDEALYKAKKLGRDRFIVKIERSNGNFNFNL
jgi:diguanylate cyclase (GGDEF)-like protein